MPTKERNFEQPAFGAFAFSLGRMVLAWNDLHLSLFGLFWVTLNIPNGLTPGAIWHALKVDRAQRDMLRALIVAPALGHRLDETTHKDLKWLLDKTESLEDARNNLIHTPFATDGRKYIPSYGAA